MTGLERFIEWAEDFNKRTELREDDTYHETLDRCIAKAKKYLAEEAEARAWLNEQKDKGE